MPLSHKNHWGEYTKAVKALGKVEKDEKEDLNAKIQKLEGDRKEARKM